MFANGLLTLNQILKTMARTTNIGFAIGWQTEQHWTANRL